MRTEGSGSQTRAGEAHIDWSDQYSGVDPGGGGGWVVWHHTKQGALIGGSGGMLPGKILVYTFNFLQSGAQNNICRSAQRRGLRTHVCMKSH